MSNRFLIPQIGVVRRPGADELSGDSPREFTRSLGLRGKTSMLDKSSGLIMATKWSFLPARKFIHGLRVGRRTSVEGLSLALRACLHTVRVESAEVLSFFLPEGDSISARACP